MSWERRPPPLMDMYSEPHQSNPFQYLRHLLENEILKYCVLSRTEAENRSAGNKEKDGSFLPNFPFDTIAKHLVNKYGLSLAVDQLTEILHFMPDYNAARPSGHLYTQAGLTKSTAVSPIVFQILFKIIVVPDPTDRRPEGKTKKNAKRAPRMMLNNLTDLQTSKIFNAVVAIDVNVEAKILSKASFMLQLRDKMDQFGPEAVRAVKEGWASFASTIFFMHNPAFSVYFDSSEVIRTALCQGPLRATTVESFASNRPKEFRQSCREMLLLAEQTAATHSFLSFCPNHLVHRYGAIRFEANVRALMDELRGEVKHDQLINPGWAFAAIKKYSKKTFQDKEWAYENLHELFWAVLYQRPNLRKNIVGICRAENDQLAAYWQRISTANASIADVPRDIPLVTGDPLDASIVPGGPFLSFSNEMREVIFVNTDKLVTEMSADIERRAAGPDGVMLALDAEWSAYESYAAASILQIALDDVSYIVDVDTLPRDVVRPFIEMLFSHESILKLGFQFHEDLAQLRMAKSLRGCASLHRPKNLSCVLKLIVALVEESERRANGAEILEEFGVGLSPIGVVERAEGVEEGEEKEEESEEKGGEESGVLADTATTSTDETTAEKPAAVTRVRPSTVVTRVSTRSLSSLCESLLGLPLDKREQCSVWTRRPLRALQLRYAAMDAYCLLLLHTRCKEWAEKLGVPIEEMMSRHFEQHCSLPLFIGD
ncbi:hypothetical protein PFISCL1PPCAC_7824 [Pristionchus fissidentatus]|uniref:3'-5' exonuclease domain-containing protein n=1 Tax=Pristionchus fissidentatus TaxID=1538716 RepID=A0AAV5VEE5_9BILA|nr:hypothetical protein PFISCL1PPCAC_7824 [Pristionchus fissidentatus]